MSDETPTPDLSQPIGWPVKKSVPVLVHGLAAVLLSKAVPCYGYFLKDRPRCGECLLRDLCRVDLGTHAATQVDSLNAAIAASQAAPPPLTLDPVATPNQFKKGFVRNDGLLCCLCNNPMENGTECLRRKSDNAPAHTSCGEPSAT